MKYDGQLYYLDGTIVKEKGKSLLCPPYIAVECIVSCKYPHKIYLKVRRYLSYLLAVVHRSDVFVGHFNLGVI